MQVVTNMLVIVTTALVYRVPAGQGKLEKENLCGQGKVRENIKPIFKKSWKIKMINDPMISTQTSRETQNLMSSDALKYVFSWGYAPNFTRGAHDDPPDHF